MKKLKLSQNCSWNSINWKLIQKTVFKWQQKIYSVSKVNDIKKVRILQHLVINSKYGKLLAIRRVTQDNQGKKTAGVDGVKSLNPRQRSALVSTMKILQSCSPLRRVWIPKPGKSEKRPLGIPTIKDRCMQALFKLAMEPEWEAKFEPNSYGFRPGRSAHDALCAIKNCIQKRAKYVLDADIAKCFDKINHKKLLDKIGFKGKYRKQIEYWLKAGVIDGEMLSSTEMGTPQGGVISPLLVNIALHGMETAVKNCFKDIPVYWESIAKVKPSRIRETLHFIRYADDFVVLHDNIDVILRCKETIQNFLKEIGLELSEAKTRITHTLDVKSNDINKFEFDGKTGFNFLGFTIKQFKTKHQSAHNTQGEKLLYKTLIYPSRKSINTHQDKLHKLILKDGKRLDQPKLIKKLNKIIRGWANYFGKSNANTTGHLEQQDYLLYLKLRHWAKRVKGSSKKGAKYWNRNGKRKWVFSTPDKKTSLLQHIDYAKPLGTSNGYVKVKQDLSPFDENQIYWAQRLQKSDIYPIRVQNLLKKQKGICSWCKLKFTEGDVIEVDHIVPRLHKGEDKYENLQALHHHCHDLKTRQDVIEHNGRTS